MLTLSMHKIQTICGILAVQVNVVKLWRPVTIMVSVCCGQWHIVYICLLPAAMERESGHVIQINYFILFIYFCKIIYSMGPSTL
jgi:hypothetical protein